MIIYTDGSMDYRDRSGGWAFVVVENNKIVCERRGKLKETTVHQAELTAILKAFEYAISEGAKSIEILTDSRYCQRGFNEWIFEWPNRDWKTTSGNTTVNAHLWQKAPPLMLQVEKIKVRWIKGHNGNPFNSRADKLASRSTR